MKLMKFLEKLLENEFKLHDTRTRMPPKPPCFDEIVIKFKFKTNVKKFVNDFDKIGLTGGGGAP